MDLWTFQRYAQPRLCVDSIAHDPDDKFVQLRAGSQRYRFAFDNPQAAEQTAGDLRALADSAAPQWATVRGSEPGSGWHGLATFLDTHSLLAEDQGDAAQALVAQARRLRQCVDATCHAVVENLPAPRRALVARHAADLLLALQRGDGEDDGADPFDAAIQPNFFLALLTAECQYFRRFAPPTLAAATLLLAQLAGGDGAGQPEALPDDAAGLYDERDLASHLWLLGQALALSTGDDAARFATAPMPTPALASGLEFMRQVELLTRENLDLWGENPYLTAINGLDGAYAPLVAGPFIEQYHVTTRFVEIIAPLLSKRLAAPLRAMMFRYFGEEYGHEALESTTCQALGVAELVLNKTVPLPLHYAFVDMLTLLAARDPVTSFAAIMVIEGIYGEPPKMSLRLLAAVRKNTAFGHVSGDHDKLNASLNHNSISRDLFACIDAVSPARQAIVMRRIVFMLELNHRAWGGIANFYGAQQQLQLQGAYGTLLAPGG